MTDITVIVKAIVYLAEAVLLVYIIPFIKTKIDQQKLNKILDLVDIAVAAAEQIGANLGYTGEEKKLYVEHWLEGHGYVINSDINNYIEAAVIELHNELRAE